MMKEPAYDAIKEINIVSNEGIQRIQEKTVRQSQSNLWKEVRKSRITASFVGEIVEMR